MAELEKDSEAKVGLGAQEWLEMWEGDWTEGSIQGEGTPGGDQGSQSHHDQSNEPQSCNEPDSEFDEHGNKIKVDAYLTKYLDQLTDGKTENTIFVSLCGDTLDMEWLCSEGYSVVGVELSETAAKRAFERPKAPVPFEVLTEGSLKIYSATDGKKMKIYIGNFFDDAINSQEMGSFHCIWDSHGIVSIPVPQHESYAKKLITFLKPGGKMLFSTVEYEVSKLESGPAPAPVPVSTLQRFYPQCKVQLLENLPLPAGQLKGVNEWTNPITLVTSTS